MFEIRSVLRFYDNFNNLYQEPLWLLPVYLFLILSTGMSIGNKLRLVAALADANMIVDSFVSFLFDSYKLQETSSRQDVESSLAYSGALSNTNLNGRTRTGFPRT